MMRRSTLFALMLALAGCRGQKAEPEVARAWVRLPAVTGQPAAAYFSIEGGRHDTQLVRIESALAAKVELHESISGMQGMSTMAPVDRVAVPAATTVRFKPGGQHAMLIGLDAVVQPGTAVPLRFGFADGSTAEAEAKTVGPAADAPY